MGEPELPTRALRAVLAAALRVVRAEALADPPVEPPGPLRPLLSHSRLTGPAYETLRRVLDADRDLRRRVAAALGEGEGGDLGRLWLERPDGWAERAATLAGDDDGDGAGRGDRSAERRVEAATKARQRAEAALADALARLEERSAELRAERRRADAAHAAAQALRDEVDAAVARADDADARAAAAIVRADDATTALEAAQARIVALDAEVAALGAELDDATRRRDTALRAAARVQRVAADERAAAGAAIADAAGGAALLADALARAAAALGGPPGGGRQPPPGAPRPNPATERPDGVAGAPDVDGAAAPAADPPRRRPPARQAVPVPPGVFDDSLAWADRLVRMRGAALLVDGYNITLSAWGAEPLPAQRRRLVDALGELHARCGVDVQVVFDAHPSEVMAPEPGRPRAAVRCSFSPTGEDADEVLLDLVERIDAARVVVVATDDKRVRSEVAARGANVISRQQLLGLLGRHPRP